MTADLPVVTRGVRESDWPLILDSWVASVRFATPGLCWVPGGVRKSFRRIVLGILQQHPDWFRLLVDEDDDDTIYSWSCTDCGRVHFLYTKIEFRRMGLATTLVPMPWVCTSWTRDCEHIDGLTYRPSGLVEVIRGLDGPVEREHPRKDQRVRATDGHDSAVRHDQAEGDAAATG